MASKINPTSGWTAVSAGGVVGDTLAAPLASAVIPVSGGDFLDFTIEVATVGAATGISVQAVFTLEKDPPTWTPATSGTWADVTSQSIVAGVATLSTYEQRYAAADFFAGANTKFGGTFPVRGGHVTLLVWDTVGDGSGSSVTIKVATRES